MIGLWGGRDRRSISLEITIYLTLGALVSLCGLVALNAMVDSPKFDFPSLSAALAETSLSSPRLPQSSDCYFLDLVFWSLSSLFILGPPGDMKQHLLLYPCSMPGC